MFTCAKRFAVANLTLHFISSVDKIPLNEVLQQIDPEATLFIISSKSFTTIETLTNARTILEWMQTKFQTIAEGERHSRICK